MAYLIPSQEIFADIAASAIVTMFALNSCRVSEDLIVRVFGDPDNFLIFPHFRNVCCTSLKTHRARGASAGTIRDDPDIVNIVPPKDGPEEGPMVLMTGLKNV